MPDQPRTASAHGSDEARRLLAKISAEKQEVDALIVQSNETLAQARAALAEAENVLRRR